MNTRQIKSFLASSVPTSTPRQLRVLVACEFSGTVRDAFAKKGWDAWSCDLLPSEKPGNHIIGDIFHAIADSVPFDLMIAHPPCTFLTTSGNKWFYHPDDKDLDMDMRRPHPSYPHRTQHREEAVDFVRQLMEVDIPHIALENPVGTLSSRYRKPDQIMHPYHFGHDASKGTCLWLKDLPQLYATQYVPPRILENGLPRWANQCDGSGARKEPPSPDRWKDRSRTYQGIANAMAAQWTKYLKRFYK